MYTRPRTSLISFCTVQLRTLCAAHSLATLCLSTTSGPDPGEFPGFWGSMVFRRAPIPWKGSGNQQQQHIKQVNYFKIFMDKVYTIFLQSSKNQMQFIKISEMLWQQILKIGRVLGPRSAACSLRSALAVWRAYPALYKYFSSEAKHSGMAARLCNRYLVALMIDILQEISLLSDAL